MNFAVPLIGLAARRAIMPLLDLVVSLVELIGYCGNHPQHHDHSYAHPDKRHVLLFTIQFTVYS